MGSNKRELDAFINDNYKELVKLSRKMSNKYKVNGQPMDLLSETVLTMYEELGKKNEKLLACIKSGDTIKFFGQTMSNITRWSNSKYNRQMSPREVPQDIAAAEQNFEESIGLVSLSENTFNTYLGMCLQENHVDKIILQAEDTNEQTKEFTQDWINSGMTDRNIKKYFDLMDFKNTLQPHELRLFELHFENGMSTRTIAKDLTEKAGYPINYQSIRFMVLKIKDKIKNKQWN